MDRTLIRCYHSWPAWTCERWQCRGTPHSPKLQHYWSLTIRLFSVISRTLVGRGSYSFAEKQSVCSTAPIFFLNGITNKLFTYKSYVWPFNWMQTNELGPILKCYLQNVYKSYIFNICINRIWYQITYVDWFAIKIQPTNQPTSLSVQFFCFQWPLQTSGSIPAIRIISSD